MLPLLKKYLKLNPHALLEVGWMDASSSPTETGDPSEIGDLIAIKSAGFFARADKEIFVLATDVWPESDMMRGAASIPTGWIIYVKTGLEIFKSVRYKKYCNFFGMEGSIPENAPTPMSTNAQFKAQDALKER